MSLQTTYEFTLPRGFVDEQGAVHRKGVMRLATARDELEPLRDPTIAGPEDPRLTVVVLARVVSTLGSLELVTVREIENLFAADLAYLQDFYGVINFGTQAEYEAFVTGESADLVSSSTVSRAAVPDPGSGPAVPEDAAQPVATGGPEQWATAVAAEDEATTQRTPATTGASRPGRSSIEEIPSESR